MLTPGAQEVLVHIFCLPESASSGVLAKVKPGISKYQWTLNYLSSDAPNWSSL